MSQAGPDRKGAEIARAQHGVLRLGDAADAGLTERMTRTRVANGLLQRVGPGVLRVTGAAVTWRQELLVAVFSGGSEAVASHRAAALLHDLDTFRRRTSPEPVTQHHVRRPDGRNAFVDFAHVDLRLGIEVDGHGSHATRVQRAGDAERANQLALAGWTILRFTYEDVHHRPEVVVTTVQRARAASRDAA